MLLSNINKEIEMTEKTARFTGFVTILQSKPLKLILATIAGGIGMWVTAGFWHNLILPSFDNKILPHHDGLIIALVAYFILSFLMAYIYLLSYKGIKPVFEGLKIGVIIGILWVFPHGLAMAGEHNTSIIYEVQNTFYHMIEQGIGGIIIASILGKKNYQ